MDMDIQESKARRHNERLFFEMDLEAARRSNDSDKARHEAEQALLRRQSTMVAVVVVSAAEPSTAEEASSKISWLLLA